MPYTLSHPLAVVPIRRYSPIPLSFAALVMGSMSPDFGYFVEQFDIAAFAHTIPGTFAVCLPSSLFVLAVFYLVRRAVCFVFARATSQRAISTCERSPRAFVSRTRDHGRFDSSWCMDTHDLGFHHACARLERVAICRASRARRNRQLAIAALPIAAAREFHHRTRRHHAALFPLAT